MLKMPRLITLLFIFGITPYASASADEAQVTAPAGFVVDKIFEVPASVGSWASLTRDDRGRLIAGDEAGAGMFLITPPEIGDVKSKTVVEKLPIDLGGCQGMLWAFDSLYAHVSKKGLYRVTDTDNDGRVDSAELLMANEGGGGHGQHAVVLSPDGKSLFVAGGNHVALPKTLKGSRIPQNWGEDLLLPRRWDARGHAAGRLAPGGWICEVSPDGKDWTVYSTGYRNQYDIAFNAEGDLFTYDADMEWDMGTPWYRPTRVLHATSGSEYGWRSGTGKWPTYYEDSLPPVLNIGPGSPTGVLFGAGAKFPAKYQRTFFMLDWTYSTIHAVELTPRGSSYTATKEDFVVGKAMSVTDAVIGLDGAMYFVVGGRRSQSALYRVTYQGNESTAPVDPKNPAGADARALRHRLEGMHVGGKADLDLIFANLGNEDRFIRYAARIALENQPVASWRKRALEASDPLTSTCGMIALARQGKPADQPAVLATLGKLEFAALSEDQQLSLLRAYELTFIRLGEPKESMRSKLVEKLDPLFPSKSDSVNHELVQLLVYLRAPAVITKAFALAKSLGAEEIPDWGELAKRNDRYGGTVARMLEKMPPVRKLHLMFVLRNIKEGWTLDQRKEYFEMFVSAAKQLGGNSYAGFLTQVRDDALATCSPSEKVVLGELASAPLTAETFVPTPAKGPRRKWTKPEALAALRGSLNKRDLASGRNLFHAAQCAKCHRFNGEGGAIGPDLSTALQKYSIPDLLDSVFEPSKVISDQYGSHQVLTNDGQVLLGRAVEIGDKLYIYTIESGSHPKIIKRSEVEEMRVSKMSQMPVGLIDALNAEELKDLIAYLKSGGKKKRK